MGCKVGHITSSCLFRTRVELTIVSTACFDGLPVHIIQFLNHLPGDRWIKIDRAAAKYLNEFKLRAWIIEQNVLKGLAVPNREVGTYFDNFIVAVQPHAAVPHVPRSDMTIVKNRRRMQTFRGRWNITLEKVASGDIVSPTEISEKVSHF